MVTILTMLKHCDSLSEKAMASKTQIAFQLYKDLWPLKLCRWTPHFKLNFQCLKSSGVTLAPSLGCKLTTVNNTLQNCMVFIRKRSHNIVDYVPINTFKNHSEVLPVFLPFGKSVLSEDNVAFTSHVSARTSCEHKHELFANKYLTNC